MNRVNAFSNRSINAGWTAGGGVEAHLGGHWTGKIEYLYMDFGSVNASSTNQQNMTLTTQFNSHITDQLVRAGLNYKFDPLEADAPVLITKDAVLVAPWTWAGFYAGFNVGYGSGSSDTDTLLSDATTGNPLQSTNASSSKLRGAIFGGQAGYNLVAGNWLAGVELDFQRSNQREIGQTFAQGQFAIRGSPLPMRRSPPACSKAWNGSARCGRASAQWSTPTPWAISPAAWPSAGSRRQAP